VQRAGGHPKEKEQLKIQLALAHGRELLTIAYPFADLISSNMVCYILYLHRREWIIAKHASQGKFFVDQRFYPFTICSFCRRDVLR